MPPFFFSAVFLSASIILTHFHTIISPSPLFSIDVKATLTAQRGTHSVVARRKKPKWRFQTANFLAVQRVTWMEWSPQTTHPHDFVVALSAFSNTHSCFLSSIGAVDSERQCHSFIVTVTVANILRRPDCVGTRCPCPSPFIFKSFSLSPTLFPSLCVSVPPGPQAQA